MRPSKDPQKALGAAFSELREEQDVTQREIAKKAEITKAHYSAIEDGKANPTWGTVRRLAKAYGVTVAELAMRQEAQTPEHGYRR